MKCWDTKRKGLQIGVTMGAVIWAALMLCSLGAKAQILTITNGVQTYASLSATTVNMSGRCELHITSTATPLSGCTINLDSPDAWLFLTGIKPSVVVSTYLGQVRISSAAAVADVNCRVVQYDYGAVVIPQSASFQPLQVFSGPHFTGSSASLSKYVYYKGNGLGSMNAAISSFKLKRGYMVTLAQNENGSGTSKNYVAQDGDMEVSVLPADFDNTVRFAYVLPWRWVGKKGSCDASPTDLNADWWYNWNINQNSTRDLEYVAIRQQPYWPGLNQDWQARSVNHLSGYNEPNNPVEDAYKNLNPPGSTDDAVARWPDLLATGLRVGAPAVSDGGQGWITDFMNKANAAGVRVDYVPIHYYRCYGNNADPSGAANQLYNFLKGIYDAVKRPIWVTEFNNGANWTGCADPTYAQNAAVIQAMIQMMDDTPWIERYSIYSRVETNRQTHYDGGGLTPMGVMYRDHPAPLAYLQALQDNGTRSFSQLQFDGDSLDSSGHGNNGLISSSPIYTNGHSGQALVFDGVNTKVTLPPNIANNNAFTFAAWLNWKGGGDWQRIFDFGNSTTQYLFLTPRSGSGTLRFAIKDGGSEQIAQTTALAQNLWQHVAVTLGGNIARLYVNGSLVASASVTITPANFSPRVNFLGESQFIADPLFNGMMDDVLITDYAMSPAQIAALQTNMPPQFTDSLYSRGSAIEGQSYSNSIAGTATDADTGGTVTYTKAAGPAWLNVAPDGTLSGSPFGGQGGMQYFTVCATDTAGESAFALVTIDVTVTTASGTWIADASAGWSELARWSGNVVANGVGQTADFSTVNITANRTVTLSTSRSIGTLKFGDTSGGQTWTINSTSNSVLTLDTGSATPPSIVVANTATISAPLAGTSGFNKIGNGTFVLAGNSSLSGTVKIDTSSTTANEGAVRAAHPNALANATLIQILDNNSGSSTLQLDGTAGDVIVPAAIAVNCRNNDVPTIQNLSGTNTLSGDVSLNVGGNRFNIRSDAGLLVFSGQNQYVGSLIGGRSYAFSGAGDHLVIGPILNSMNGAPIGLTKSGTGTLILAGNNTYGSSTSVSGGTLRVNGSIGSGAVTIAGSATLSGNGTIGGPVTIQNNGTLSPGASIGALTINNSLTTMGTIVMDLNKAGTTLTNDSIKGLNMIAYGGALQLVLSGEPLMSGDHFELFSATSYVGSFANIVPPAPGPGLLWDTTELNNGTLGVIAAPVPRFTSFSFSGTDLIMTGTNGTPNGTYYVLCSTNLALPLTNWTLLLTDRFNASGAFTFTNVTSASVPQEFYLIQVP